MQRYLQMARECPGLLCSQVPLEILEAATDDGVEPSQFIQEFLEAGHTQWLVQKHGRVRRGEQQIKNAVVVLWVRAGRLFNSHTLGRLDPDWDNPFFSDEGLY